ncbi:MAG: DUF503 domain-containing protein [Nitrospinae bacterium]|nr:DUF503 domain-containing protein [Nitrospinota bacterium]
MVIGVARLSFHLPGNSSLKGKRKVVKSVIDRVKSRFNVTVAEVDHMDLHQRATIGVAVVSNEAPHADSQIQTVIRFVGESVELLDVNIELITL